MPAKQSDPFENDDDAKPAPAAKTSGNGRKTAAPPSYRVRKLMHRDGNPLPLGSSVTFREDEDEHVAELLLIGAIEPE